jgi:hypothetical protein
MKNKLKCLFLDDQRDPKNAYVHIGTGHDHKKKSLIELSGIEADDWSVTRSYESFSHYLKYVGIPDVVSFDHDLSEEHMKHYFTVTQQIGIVDYGNLKPDSGFHCAKLLCQKCLDTNTKFPKYYVHSANKWGGENIKNYIENFLKVYEHLQTHD